MSVVSNFRRSAGLIMLGNKNKLERNGYDYKVLVTKRSPTLKMWPGYHVFPGGRISDSDESPDWLSVLLGNTPDHESIRSDSVKCLRSVFHDLTKRSTSFGHRITKDYQLNPLSLPPEISYRLCALRETFEETGILLATKRNDEEKRGEEPPQPHINFARGLTSRVNNYGLEPQQLIEWQQRVHQDPKQFLQMFRELKLIPNITGLYQWSNWLAPTFEKIRFDSVFFTCFLPFIPSASEMNTQSNECEEIEFVSPDVLLNKHKNKEVKLMPPQAYDLSKLLKFSSINQVYNHAVELQTKELVLYLPKFDKGARLGILPGDSNYDKLPSDYDPKELSNFDEQITSDSKVKINRLIRNVDDNKFMQVEVKCNL